MAARLTGRQAPAAALIEVGLDQPRGLAAQGRDRRPYTRYTRGAVILRAM